MHIQNQANITKILRIKRRRRKRQGIVGPHKSDPFNKGFCVGLQR